MAVMIRATSRLQYARLIVLDGVEHWDSPEYPEIPVRADDLDHEVDILDRIDLIAYKYYRDSTLGWVIALANEIYIPEVQIHPRMTLRIPSPQFVFTEIVRRRKRQQ